MWKVNDGQLTEGSGALKIVLIHGYKNTKFDISTIYTNLYTN